MTNYREILRMNSLGFNKTEISQSLQCSRTTVRTVIRLAEEHNLPYLLPGELSDKDLYEALFPAASGKVKYKMPDYEHVYKELQRDGVTLDLLWREYVDECRLAGELPYQLTQFNKYYNDFCARKNATMHLNHKPGEIMQVDWASDTTGITFQKTTEGELNVLSNIDLIGSIVDIADQIADLYKVESFTKDFTMKTAVGSPGIIELIIPMLSSAPMVLGAVILWLLLGKYDSEKGISSGLTSIFNMVNKHLNDKKERELKDAEIKGKEAGAQVKIAEAAKIQAETEKIRLETELLKKPAQEPELKIDRNGQMMFDTTPPLMLIELTEPTEAEVQACLAPIAANCIKCAEAAKANGIHTGKK